MRQESFNNRPIKRQNQAGERLVVYSLLHIEGAQIEVIYVTVDHDGNSLCSGESQALDGQPANWCMEVKDVGKLVFKYGSQTLEYQL